MDFISTDFVWEEYTPECKKIFDREIELIKIYMEPISQRNDAVHETQYHE